MKTYWHKLTKAERYQEMETGYTNKEFLRRYKQPDWCGYPHQEALHLGGCWNLHGGKIKKREDCGTCKRLVPNENN